MGLHKDDIDNPEKLFHLVDQDNYQDETEKCNYLYPNGHRMTPQMRWLKGSRDRGLITDIAK